MDFLYALIFLPLDSAPALYALLFLVLIFSGIGLPIPEEITLLFGGYLAHLQFIEFWPAVYVLIAGIMAADVLGYLLGRLAGEWFSTKAHRFKTASFFLEKAGYYFDRHGEKVLLFSRPLLGVRVAVPILAGHFKMNFLKFVLFDLLGAISWTLLLVSISYYFGLGLDLITDIKEIKHIIFAGVAVVIFLVVGLKLFQKENNATIV